MLFSNVDWTLAGGVIITGLTVVFFVLAFLWFLVVILGKIVPLVEKSFAPKPKAEKDTGTPAPAQGAPRAALTGEVVAAITAAVATTTDKNFTIKSISLKGDDTPLWTADN